MKIKRFRELISEAGMYGYECREKDLILNRLEHSKRVPFEEWNEAYHDYLDDDELCEVCMGKMIKLACNVVEYYICYANIENRNVYVRGGDDFYRKFIKADITPDDVEKLYLLANDASSYNANIILEKISPYLNPEQMGNLMKSKNIYEGWHADFTERLLQLRLGFRFWFEIFVGENTGEYARKIAKKKIESFARIKLDDLKWAYEKTNGRPKEFADWVLYQIGHSDAHLKELFDLVDWNDAEQAESNLGVYLKRIIPRGSFDRMKEAI